MKTPLNQSTLFLIGSNLVPIFGVVYLGWDAASILMLYWLEGLIIGLINLPKIMMSLGSLKDRLFSSLFFTVHYGLFAFVHGNLLSRFLGIDLTHILIHPSILVSAIGFFISHLVSFMINFFGQREFANRKPNQQMMRVYGRVLIMHIVAIFGAFMVSAFGSPMGALVLLIFVKLAADIIAHRRSHRDSQNTINTQKL